MMIRIENSEEFYSILKAFKKKNRKIISNFLMFPEELETLVREKKVFYMEGEAGISLFVEYETHFSFYFFYIGLDVPIEVRRLEKPVVCEIFTKNQLEEGIDERFIKENFRQIGVYKRYTLKSENIHDVKSGSSVRKKAGAIHEVWDGIKENFNVLTDHLVSQDEMEEKYADKQFFYYNQANIIEGALIHETKNKKSVLEYIFVYPEFRKKGVARELLETWLVTYFSAINKFELWVSTENKKAIELYKRYGFQEDGLIKYVYLI